MVGKQAVIEMRERNGKVKARPINSTKTPDIHDAVYSSVEIRSTIYTDEWRLYQSLDITINQSHSAKEHVNGMVYTNGIESV